MTNHRVLAAVALVLCVSGLIVPGLAGATPGGGTADLAIEQPHYIDSEVSRTNVNGTAVYKVAGPQQELVPQNFQAEDVVSYGVEESGAELAYDDEMQQFTFQPEETGTYTVYWVTEYETNVQQDNETVTVTRQERYSARIRVSGQIDMQHVAPGTLAEQEEAAGNWRELNATVQELRGRSLLTQLGLQDKPSTEEVVQGMVNSYILTNDPLAALTGNITTVIIILSTTLGGLLLLLIWTGYHTAVVAHIRGEQNLFESVESAEGDLADRIETLEYEESLQALANLDFNDVWSDDHIAAAMRDLGDTPKDAIEHLHSVLRPRYILHDRLQAMGQCGYTVVIDEWKVTSDSDGTDSKPASARVARADSVDADADTIPLADVDSPEHPVLDALDWSQPAIREFDLVHADYDPSSIETSYEHHSLDDLVDAVGIDERHFTDNQEAAEYLVEFVDAVRRHDITEETGEIDSVRWTLNQWLDTAHVVSDRFELPMQTVRDRLERTLVDYDRGEEAERVLEDIDGGKYA